MKRTILLLLIFAISLSLLGGIPVAAASDDGAGSNSGDDIIASFHVIYDVHVPRDTAAYERSLKNMAKINPQTSIALVIGGDNTVTNQKSELDTFYGLLKQYNPVSDEQTVVIIGNHDARGPNENGNWVSDPTKSFPYWETAKALYASYNKNYMPESAQTTIYHAKEIGGYTFIALNTDLGLKDQMHMSDEYLEWFEQTMKTAYEADPTKPIFIISHQPMQNTVWRTSNRGLDHSNNNYTTGLDAKVQKILEKYPTAIFISGHMHNELNQIEAVLRPWASYVDVPAHYADAEKKREGGLGFEAEIYSDRVVFRAVNFAKNEWYPEYDLLIPTTNGGFSAIYQAARKQITGYSDNFDIDDRFFLSVLNGMLTKKYNDSAPRENQFYYTGDKLEKIRLAAEDLKARIGPLPGDRLSLQQSEVNLQLGTNETAQISAFVGETAVNNKHLVWSSSNENVVKVVDGNLTAVSAGVAKISVTSLYDDSIEASCMVDVSTVAETENKNCEETPEKGCRAGIGVLPPALTLALVPIVIKKKKK